jgi:hypothetical protein
VYAHNHTSKAFFATLLVLLSFGVCHAQATPPKNSNSPSGDLPPLKDLADKLPPDPAPGPATGSSGAIVVVEAPPGGVPLDDSTKAAYLSALRAYYQYKQSGLEHRQKVFAWQLLSSRIIFFTVIALVLSGVYFSGVQFHSALRSARKSALLRRPAASKAGLSARAESGTQRAAEDRSKSKAVSADADKESAPADDTSPGDTLLTEIEASLQGFRVSSPVLGVIILALSFLFFYLYLKYVYPINEIF